MNYYLIKILKLWGEKFRKTIFFVFTFLWCRFSFLLVILFQENVQHCINFRHYCKFFLHTVGPCSKRFVYAGTWETLKTFLYAKLGPDGGSLGTTPGAKGWITLIKYENGTALMFQFFTDVFLQINKPTPTSSSLAEPAQYKQQMHVLKTTNLISVFGDLHPPPLPICTKFFCQAWTLHHRQETTH